MKSLLILSLVVLMFANCNSDDEPTANITEYEGYTLLWNDEFDGTSINKLNWTYEIGDGTAYGLNPGWGNNEKQLYTDSPESAYIEKDKEDVSALVIEANEAGNDAYTSAKMTTQGLQSFRYGRIEARIKLPTDQGLWPAFWMLGDNISEVDWPGCGEIDIVELVGLQPNVIHGTAHYTNAENKHNFNGNENLLVAGNFDAAYHNFRLNWTPETMVFYLDGQEYHSINIEEDMKEFQRSFYLILNVAVGGNWPGDPDESTVFPQKMYVDYIRVYTKDGFVAPDAPVLDIAEETIGTIIPASLAQYAFNSTLNQFPDISSKSYGGGGEPNISSTDITVEGDSALMFSYPGGNWGGGWFQLENPLDLSSFASGDLVFSLREPAELASVELKLEAVSNSAAIFLVDYTPVSIDNNFVEYRISLTDFTDLDLSAIKIPFSFWNPVDENGEYPAVDIIIDNIYFE